MYIDLNSSIAHVAQLLIEIGFINPKEESVESIEKPGEGNMNVVLRIRTNKRSFIFKQSRPYVQKYPDIPAPLNRIAVENQFYALAKTDAIAAHMPSILGYYSKESILILEDLGECRDMTYLYADKKIADEDLNLLIDFARQIHTTKVDSDYPDNMALRILNHQHIFVLPFLEDNGMSLNDVQAGLEDLAQTYKADEVLKREILKVGEQYLSKGHTLIHGDYYPGSWMTNSNKLYVIDPEFSFMGFAEFDMAVLAAHLVLITMDTAVVATITNQYAGDLNEALFRKLIGIEIMRRLIGLAQLPLERTIPEKKKMLETARSLILGGPSLPS